MPDDKRLAQGNCISIHSWLIACKRVDIKRKLNNKAEIMRRFLAKNSLTIILYIDGYHVRAAMPFDAVFFIPETASILHQKAPASCGWAEMPVMG